ALQPVIAGVVTFIRGVIATLQGNQGKGASIFASLGLDPATVREAIASLTAFRNGAITAFGAVKTAIQTLKTFVAGLFALFTGNTGKGASLLTSIGLSPGAVLAIMAAVNQIKSGFSAVF
ncbi:Clp protease N-terminal domain-containing protein, partial [Staphylococcus sp. SIMBA_130]